MSLPAVLMLTAAALLLAPTDAIAGCSIPPAPATAIAKGQTGSGCPAGYRPSGGSCLPGKGARPALAKPPGETCPTGYTGSGDFCLAGIAACHALRKTGPCPSGYRASGRNWCLSD